MTPVRIFPPYQHLLTKIPASSHWNPVIQFQKLMFSVLIHDSPHTDTTIDP